MSDRSVNYQGSMSDVISTIGPVLQEFIHGLIRKEMPDCNYVYDPELTYESAVKRLRDNNNMDKGVKAKPLPLFVFRRSALRYPDDGLSPNSRMTHSRGSIRHPDGTTTQYSVVHAEFDLDFLYISPNMEQLERFEITFLSEDGITGTRQIEVKLPELDNFTYFLTWNKLLDVEVNAEGSYYKSLASTLRVRGFYFIFSSKSKYIQTIQQNLKAFYDSVSAQNNEVLSSITIS